MLDECANAATAQHDNNNERESFIAQTPAAEQLFGRVFAARIAFSARLITAGRTDNVGAFPHNTTAAFSAKDHRSPLAAPLWVAVSATGAAVRRRVRRRFVWRFVRPFVWQSELEGHRPRKEMPQLDKRYVRTVSWAEVRFHRAANASFSRHFRPCLPLVRLSRTRPVPHSPRLDSHG